ncbi:major facilitator superfamily domain-containing protein [Dactylonectria macrodidyma]|uniref:Major facilitator superfamily domain-containing protein n=1 Tax=Dactylonectria macrodidyma TaxID=307937 RepID=A0A9P9IQP7_9HYPO|nr:major facilitator superfamily domain-containing protein [Dactylonectria macrodidyma]
MDTITPLEAAMYQPKPPIGSENSPNAPPIEPLDPVESLKPRTKLRLYAILSGLYLSLLVAALDSTIVAIAIPTISAELHSALGYVWIGGAYLLATAATSPIWSKCSDIWGRKSLLLIAVGLFAASSVLAALSTNMSMLIAARALQGAGCGGLSQLVTITISDLFSVRKRSLYLGLVGFVWAFAGSVGPLLGGAFTQFASWRWCFWINLPICAITFGLLLCFLDVHNPRTKLVEGAKAIDWVGTVSILAITLLLLVGLDLGGAIFPWSSPKVICLLVSGTLMIGFFIFTEQRLAKYPLMPLEVFKNWSNNATFLVASSQAMILVGGEYYLPLFFQSVQQASPLRSGVLMLPLIVTQAVVEILAGIYIHRTGRYRESIWAGAALMTLGTGLYISLGTHTSVSVVVGLEIIGALGPALLFQGPMVAIQNTVSQADTAAATAALGFVRNVAMTLAVVVGGVVFQNSMDARQSSFVAAGLDESVREALSGSQAAANVGITSSIQDVLQRQVVLEAFAWSMRNMFIMYTCLAAVALLASAFIKHRDLNVEHTETTTGIQHLTKGRKTEG